MQRWSGSTAARPRRSLPSPTPDNGTSFRPRARRSCPMLDRNIPPNAIGRQTDLFGVTAMSFKALLTSKQGDTLSTELVAFGEAEIGTESCGERVGQYV